MNPTHRIKLPVQVDYKKSRLIDCENQVVVSKPESYFGATNYVAFLEEIAHALNHRELLRKSLDKIKRANSIHNRILYEPFNVRKFMEEVEEIAAAALRDSKGDV